MDDKVPDEQHDILILGAGLSGINTAHVLRQELPHRKFAILEARAVLGGTWSFFKYPGFRSDSYMSSFGLRWHPWPHERKIASAAQITSYLEDAAEKDGSKELIRFRHKVLGCEWRDELQRWRLEVDADGEKKLYEANFVVSCTGYYSYDKAFEVAIPGLDNFAGQVVHPQWWPEDLNYAGKRIAVIGSGATAVTIVPSLAKTADQVTMIQRSPSYVVSTRSRPKLDRFLRRFLSLGWVHWITWWADVIFEVLFTQWLLKYPGAGRKILTMEAKKRLPKDVDVNVHFNPSYGPFQQRLCICPDGEFFRALHRDNCDIVTDVIDKVVPDGILLKSGRKVDADIIVTATGLYFELLSGLIPRVNGKLVRPGDHYTWRGCMLETLPNMTFIMGYVTSSWTPGANLMAHTVVRVLKEMEKTGSSSVVPKLEHKGDTPRRLAVNATSNYFVKAADRVPKVTGEAPWYGRTNLVVDTWAWLFSSMKDGLVYTRGGTSANGLHKKTA